MYRLVLALIALLVISGCGEGAHPVAPPPRPTPFGQAHIYDDFFGAATASIEERIWAADVIVRATLTASAADTLTFNVLEYLKGTGPNTITVAAATAGRPTQWDNQEAVLFLSNADINTRAAGSSDASAAGRFTFADTTSLTFVEGRPLRGKYTGSLPEGYHVGSRNPVWLPQGAGQRSAVQGSAAGDDTLSLADLRAKIAWIGASPDSDAYDFCIRMSLEHIRLVRDWNVYHPNNQWELNEWEEQINSGLPAGHVVYTYSSDDVLPPYKEYLVRWLTGPHADLFSGQNVDDDSDPTNGFTWTLTTGRPLPAGTYRFTSHSQGEHYRPCNFKPQHGLRETVTVTAPSGTVHEAFFDILTGGAGVPLPSEFTVGGASTAIHWLEWRDGAVFLLMAPYADLAGHTLDFIALDGTVALSLDAGAATADSTAGTLTWAVASQPWRDGDELMLRIRKSTTGPTATPTPTPTPTPGPTPTPTPKPLAAPAAPLNLAAPAAGETTVDLGWDAVTGAAKYRVEYRVGSGSWTTDDDAVAGLTHQVDGLTCATAYEFRVSAYGDGSARAAEWGASAPVSKSTAACAPTDPPPADGTLSPEAAKYDVNDNGRIEVTEYLAAARDYAAGRITYAVVLEVAEAWQRDSG